MAILSAAAVLAAVAVASAFAYPALADEHNIPPITAEVNGDAFEQGHAVVVTGTIKDVDDGATGAVTMQVIDPLGSRVFLSQAQPDSEGEYRFTLVAGGPQWKVSGAYTASIHYLSDSIDVTFLYTAPPVVVEPPPPDCGPGTELVDGTCQIVQPECGPGTEMVNGTCQIIPPECGPGTELVDGVCRIVPPECEPGTELVDGMCVEIEPEVVIPPPPPAPEPEPEPEPEPVVCGEGTEMVDGQCQLIPEPETQSGSCLIATAAFGTEMAPQVQFLREVRDNTVMSTGVGSAFMDGFNTLYYAVSPSIADLERQNPAFREFVQVAITPMLASLHIMSLAEEGSDASVLSLGVLVIGLNAMMYVGAPAIVGFKVYGRVRQ